MLEQEIENLGLSDKEARVYLASLRLGKSTVQEISRQADVNRGTTYNVIEYLMSKGLMSSLVQGKKTYFTAESPEKLRSLLRMQEQELREKDLQFSRYLPELLSLYNNSDNRPKVKYYEGVEGLKSIQEEYLKVKQKEILNILNIDHLHRIDSEHINDYTKRRVKAGIWGKVIYTSSTGPTDSIPPINEKMLRKSKYIPIEQLPFKADITVFDDKVSLESYKDKAIGVVIEDKEIADSIRVMFDYIWEKSKE